MKQKRLVMFIGGERFMPPVGAVGEIVEGFDGTDYGVAFPYHPCPVGHEPYWYIPPSMLMPLTGMPLSEIEESKNGHNPAIMVG
jgi:hypothetical protein